MLFIDIVGHSNLLITQQSEQVETLRMIVRSNIKLEIGHVLFDGSLAAKE